MSYVTAVLQQLRESAVAEIHAANQKIVDIDAALSLLEGRPSEATRDIQTAPELLYQPKAPGPFDHVHWGVTDGGQTAPVQAAEPALPSMSTKAEAAEIPATVDLGTVYVQQNETPETPWDAQKQALVDAVADAAEPVKKGGRRTNEEIADDHGVTLDAVRTWLGPDGGRVTAAKIKEFAEIHPAAVTLAGGAEQPTLDEETEAPVVEAPSRPAPPTAEIPDAPVAEIPWAAEDDWAEDQPEVPAAAPQDDVEAWKPF